MLAYYLRLALYSLRKNVALTILMIVAVAFGVGACMTTLTVFRAMSGDPIPKKSGQLYAVQLDSRGPADPYKQNGDNLDDQLSYTDAAALMQERGRWRQTPLFFTSLPLRPHDAKLKPLRAYLRAAYTSFFPMFDVPFKYGRAWSAEDDERHSPVVVISKRLNDKLFGGNNSVG
jgi:putative ABC transport system permease protein